ncbi:hypothetical protein AB1Y20_015355 [Prymnesium parvum]|uniref:Uncharacterized protein n=1 Tax=Prymnesium parvum TaxID=97485 RepID=A0AB34K188_PRYPA
MNGAGTFMAQDAGVRARPWDRHKFSTVGRHEARLKPSTRLPPYLADPSQGQWANDTSSWLPASAQVGAHCGAATAPAGGRAALQRRTQAAGAAQFERGDTDSPWQRSSDAVGGHYGKDALGAVNLGSERSRYRRTNAAEIDDTLRWVARPNSKSESRARFLAEQLEKEKEHPLTRAPGAREDRASRTQPPDRRRIVGVIARDDAYHVDGVAMPPQRLGRSAVAGKVGQQVAADGSAEEFRTATGLRMEQMRKMRELKPEELEAIVKEPRTSRHDHTPGLAEAVKDPRVVLALNQIMNAPNKMAGELYKMKNTTRHV